MWLKLSALLAVAYLQGGQRQQAVAMLKDALERARLQGYMRTFIDLGEPMARLLKECLADPAVGDYAADLLAASPSAPPSADPVTGAGLPEPLSPREIEILQWLAGGLSNPEIAGRAYISINTVKKHITSIYGKLGVSSRLQAVERARQLNLLND